MSKYGRKYTHAVIATDVVVFTIKDEKLQALLIKMKKPEFRGYWAVPGGLVKGEEGLETAAFRHLSEKTGMRGVYIEQLQTFGDPKRDPFGRVVSVAYIALVSWDKHELKTSEQYGGVAWFPIAGLPKLAYDHEEIVRMAATRLKAKIEYTNIVRGLLPRRFTLTELQRAYEIILGKVIDKRNFRKKILETKIIKEVKGKISSGAHRPARMYRFVVDKPQAVEML
ncbi:MAG: NUDIX hydrolase [Parcubacteria group bacterium]|nr:NUDIX hydrolase [Parcubacteria group bacterium]